MESSNEFEKMKREWRNCKGSASYFYHNFFRDVNGNLPIRTMTDEEFDKQDFLKMNGLRLSDAGKQRDLKRWSNRRESLDDAYVIKKLSKSSGIAISDLKKMDNISELLEAKRLSIDLRRALKETKK